jgi:hypothetical protein
MPQQKWNLGDIRAPERGAPKREVRTRGRRTAMQDVVPAHAPPHEPIDVSEEYTADRQAGRESRLWRRRGTRGKKKKWIVLVVLAVVAVGITMSLFGQGAELTVYPKFKDVTVDATFTAHQNPEVNMLGYELLSLDETGERTVAATGSEPAEERATGEITLYNTFSKEPQRLIKNTRFESKDGLIFKIQDPVVIPGYTMNGTEKTPGSATAKVFAEAVGDKYNIAPSRFTIPGLKGTPQFDGMYAESKAPMAGGFTGTRLIVEPSVLEQQREAIRSELRDKLTKRLESERPAGFVLYDAATQIKFESLPSTDAGEKKATIRERAVIEAPLFAESDLARYLAQNTVVDYKNEDVRIDNPQSLTFSYATASSTAPMASAASINFKLSGKAKIVWTYDMEKLRNDLKGVTKDGLPAVLLKYQPAIERATTVMRPFWRRSFPDNPAKIKITEVVGSPSP